MIYIATPGGLEAKGGIGRIVSYFVREIERRPDAPRFAIVDTYGPGRAALMPVFFAAALLRLFFACLTRRASLLHVHMAEYGSVLRKGIITLMARALRVPVVLHLHGANFRDHCERAGPTERRLIRRVLRSAAEVVVLGAYWRDFVSEFLGPGGPRVTILVNAVEGPSSVPERAETPPLQLLFLGRVGERKGAGEFLEALASPECQAFDWTANVAGDGEVDTYRAKAEALGLAERVNFLGWTEEARSRELLAQSHIFALPSRNEGLPVAIVEAMAYGLAIVATPVGSVPTAIEDGRTGILVPPGNFPALAAALARLLGDPALRRELSSNARARFERDFDIRGFCDRLLEVYRRNVARWPA
ncbi:glycosyltransferase family 4 protein [Sabulicella glaciei]|uniref:Glycosyltransferase family 4 protein n=1 Tax=Sabulicella glaciei TaxID=2984948 RepID=A0ABT3P111_9PROT|nr:glycosyltransferase family 4 protein [Roseococcus sp. MDT2-1-1]